MAVPTPSAVYEVPRAVASCGDFISAISMARRRLMPSRRRLLLLREVRVPVLDGSVTPPAYADRINTEGDTPALPLAALGLAGHFQVDPLVTVEGGQQMGQGHADHFDLGSAKLPLKPEKGRPMYGKVYGVAKTTLYLPESLKAALARKARIEGRSEADIIREALETALAAYKGPEPTLPLFSSTDLTSERTEDLLSDFGER